MCIKPTAFLSGNKCSLLSYRPYPPRVPLLGVRAKVSGNREGSITILNVTLFYKEEGGGDRRQLLPGVMRLEVRAKRRAFCKRGRWLLCTEVRVSAREPNILLIQPHNEAKFPNYIVALNRRVTAKDWVLVRQRTIPTDRPTDCRLSVKLVPTLAD
jgi:hypothetical protein